MSTVKIKKEPTTTTAAADVQVKLESSLSTTDIKLEQHTSDIDTKVEPDSEADKEEGDIKSERDDDDDDTDQIHFTIASKKQRQFICKHPGCGHRFNHINNLRMHQHEHMLKTELNILGKTYALTRQSLSDRWPCPIPDCETTWKTTDTASVHIRRGHNITIGQQQQPQSQKTRRNRYFHGVDDFYVNGVRCGYHTTISAFLCHECRLLPECLLTHLQQKHGFDEKSIDNSALPESAVNASTDPNINQHTSNLHLASSISQPYKHPHHDIIQGWLCVTSDCGYCGCTSMNGSDHKRYNHQGEQLTTVPALVLRLVIGKSRACYFLITRMNQTSDADMAGNSRVGQHKPHFTHDENEDDVSQNETADAFSQKRQWKCEYPNCGWFFGSAKGFSAHRREHKLEVVLTVYGKTFNLSRQSEGDRWSCPVPDCGVKWKTVGIIHKHIRTAHATSMKQKRINCEDDNGQQQQIIKKRQRTIHYLRVDAFYVNGVRCGYHTTTGVFICHNCRLVPECLSTHLQQKHGNDEKSIDNALLPESARVNKSDPNSNQHTNNPHLAAAICEPYQWRNSYIVQGWLCVTSDCHYCGHTTLGQKNHQGSCHKSESLSTVPALVLRLHFGKAQASYFLIARLDSNSINSNNSTSQYNGEYDSDDGEELVLSDYSDEDDIY